MENTHQTDIKYVNFNPAQGVAGPFLATIYILSLVLYYLDKSGTLKYFQYLLPVFGILVCIQKIHKVWKESGDISKLFNIVLLLSFVNLCVVLARGVLYFRFIQEGFLFLGSIVFALTLIGNYSYYLPKLIHNCLYALIGIFILDKSTELLKILSDPSALLLGVVSSNVPTESSLSFYFAILSFYFVIEKDKTKAALSIIFMVLSFKRIAFAGFLSSILLYNIINLIHSKYDRRFFSIVLTGINFIYLWSLILLVDGSFDETISEIFGVSSNFLFMGRVDMYTNIFSKLGYVDMFGLGIGRVSDFLSNYSESGIGEGILTNLHSDILKYYLEFGAIIFPIFLYNFIFYLSRNLITFCYMVMVNIIFLTDNVSIYFGFMVLFLIVNFKLSCNNIIPTNPLNKSRQPKDILIAENELISI